LLLAVGVLLLAVGVLLLAVDVLLLAVDVLLLSSNFGCLAVLGSSLPLTAALLTSYCGQSLPRRTAKSKLLLSGNPTPRPPLDLGDQTVQTTPN